MSEYDKYYKQGGTYELPIEVFNELMDRLEEQEDMLSKYRHLQTTTGIDELMGENKRLNNIINKAIKYIKEHCIDDEFYINLSNKEKGIIDVLTILENGSDK